MRRLRSYLLPATFPIKMTTPKLGAIGIWRLASAKRKPRQSAEALGGRIYIGPRRPVAAVNKQLIAALVFAIRENLSCRAILFSIGILGFESWEQGRLSEWGFRGKSASSVGAVLWNFTWERNILSLSSAQTAFIQVVQRLIH